MKKKKKNLELRIMLDTSVLYTGSSSDLLNTEILSLIKEYSSTPDLSISWYLPNAVVSEREYQMLEKGKQLLPSIQKLEKLLGHNLNINENIIHEKVKTAINQQIKTNAIKTITLNTNNVNWEILINKALFRNMPFEKGEKEKGFKDALIAESFFQLFNSSPKTRTICRLIFVAHDKLLFETLKKETQKLSNVHIYNNIENLKSLMNTLASTVEEKLIKKIQEKASCLFFEKGNEESLFNKNNLQKQISKQFCNELELLPEGGEIRNNGTWHISNPRFIKKKTQKITWKTKVEVVSQAYKTVTCLSCPTKAIAPNNAIYSFPQTLYQQPENTNLVYQNTNNIDLNPLSNPWSAYSYAKQEELLNSIFTKENELVANGRTIFEVTWSIHITTTHLLRKPKIESVDFIKIDWENPIEE